MTATTEQAVLYVNNAGTSWPKPANVATEVDRGLSVGPWALAGEFERARASVARLLSLSDPNRLLWTPGCTTALSIAIASLAWSDGDRVVTSAVEHHAVDGPVQRLVRDRGVIHETAPYTPALPFDLDWLRATLGGGHVRLVAFSAASNVTGELLPAREIVALAHEYGALCLMDAAQTAAVCHLDAASLDVDLLCFAGHKGPLGPQGIGGLWAKDDVPFACPSAACAVGEARDLARIEPGYCDVGGINAAGVLGLAAGSEWLERHPGAFDGARAAASAFAAALRDRDGATVFGGDGPRTATVSFRLDDLSLAESKARFSEEGIVLGAGVHCAPRAIEAIGAADGTLRVSFGVFNRATDVDRVLGAVDACLRTRR